MKYNIEEVNRLIQNRRSIYPNRFSDQIVPDAIIEQMLQNANWAPTHGLTEPWRFNVFCGEGLRKLAKFQANLYKEVSEREENFSETIYNKLATKPLKASHIISIGMKRGTSQKVPEIEEIEAVACAVQNMHLTATAYGVGCYWGSGGITYFEEAKFFFNLDNQDKLLGFLYVGMPSSTWPQGKRNPIEDKVTWVVD